MRDANKADADILSLELLDPVVQVGRAPGAVIAGHPVDPVHQVFWTESLELHVRQRNAGFHFGSFRRVHEGQGDVSLGVELREIIADDPAVFHFVMGGE